MDSLYEVEFSLANEDYAALHKKSDQERALKFTKSCLRNIMTEQENKIQNAIELAKMKQAQEIMELRRDCELGDPDQFASSDESDGGLATLCFYLIIDKHILIEKNF